MTPLYIAAAYGDLKNCALLLDKGANVNQANHDGMTPLFVAAQNGHVGVVRLLLDHGADPDKAKNDGNTFVVASSNGHKEIVHLLQETKGDVYQGMLKKFWRNF